MKVPVLLGRACLATAIGVLLTAGGAAQAQQQSPIGGQPQSFAQSGGQGYGQWGGQGAGQFGQGGGFGQLEGVKQRLLQSLVQGGLLRVQAIDTAYMVQANTPNGAFVTLVVTPPPGEAGGQFQQRIQQLGQFAQGDQGATRQEIQQALQEAGVVNARVIHDAHLIQARTAGGALATLFISPTPGEGMAMQGGPGSQQFGQGMQQQQFGSPG